MNMEMQKLIDKYVQWLKDKSTLRQVDEEWVELTTPYLDRHNDYLQLYVSRTENGYRLTDDGYIISDLRSSGCDLETEKRRELLEMTLNVFGITLDGDELITTASEDNYPIKKHNIIQAMLAVNDLFFLAQPIVRSLFLEDVTLWFDANSIRYVEQVKFTGKSGFDHHFDFAIPASNGNAERLIRTINKPTRDTASAMAFAWVDTREVRKPRTDAYAILNDAEATVSNTVTEALSNYGVKPLLWSTRENYLETLAA